MLAVARATRAAAGGAIRLSADVVFEIAALIDVAGQIVGGVQD